MLRPMRTIGCELFDRRRVIPRLLSHLAGAPCRSGMSGRLLRCHRARALERSRYQWDTNHHVEIEYVPRRPLWRRHVMVIIVAIGIIAVVINIAISAR